VWLFVSVVCRVESWGSEVMVSRLRKQRVRQILLRNARAQCNVGHWQRGPTKTIDSEAVSLTERQSCLAKSQRGKFFVYSKEETIKGKIAQW
jgi:hypothetical protein